MTSYQQQIRRQITLIEEAMKHAGCWSDVAPEWVRHYQGASIPDIWQWLQFIYLPLRNQDVMKPVGYLAPQITAFVGNRAQVDPLLLQRIVELDSLTSTLSGNS
jgi:hypothetical protein